MPDSNRSWLRSRRSESLNASLTEETLTAFLRRVEHLDVEELTALLDHQQLTSTRGGIPKAETVQRYARILVDHDIEPLVNVADWCSLTGTTNG